MGSTFELSRLATTKHPEDTTPPSPMSPPSSSRVYHTLTPAFFFPTVCFDTATSLKTP